MRAGLFPGQGVPAARVLEALPENDEFVERAQVVLGFPLRRRVAVSARREGARLPTVVAQPAIFVAGMRTFFERDESCDFYAGHSLGEYAALVAAGALSFEDALRIVRVRAEAMQSAARRSPGGMAAVIGLGRDDVEQIAIATGTTIANDNAPDQIVIAGREDALSEAARRATAAGGRCVLLEVAGPFHTGAVAAAAGPLRSALEQVEIRAPAVPVISNVTARPYRSPEEIRTLLLRQLTNEVRWRETVLYLRDAGVDDFVDFGPGRVVGQLVQRTLRLSREARAGV